MVLADHGDAGKNGKNNNRMLSYHRETALQGALVLAKVEDEVGNSILRTLYVYFQPL